MSAHLELVRWRRTVAEMYASLRRDDRPGPERAAAFRAAKDRLFTEHASSPIPLADRAAFRGLAYWPYRPELALIAGLELDPDAPAPHVPRSGDGAQIAFTRIGWVRFEVGSAPCRLSVL